VWLCGSIMMSEDGSRELMQEENFKGISCNSCKYFYITWNKNHPYGCRAMGFISSKLPSIEVLEIEGRDCLSFEEKNKDLKTKKYLRTDLKKGKDGNKKFNVTV
jgi:hypothetical protein